MELRVPALATSGIWLLSLIASAQIPVPTGGKIPDTSARSGSIVATMKNTVNAGKARVGDTVRMRVTYPVLSRGVVVIPEGATLVGKVVQAVAWSKSLPESRLSIVLEKAEWKRGSVPLQAFVDGQTTVIYGGEVYGDNIMHEDEFSRDRPHARYTTAFSPRLAADTELQRPGPMAPTVFVSHKKNVVLERGIALVLRTGDAQ